MTKLVSRPSERLEKSAEQIRSVISSVLADVTAGSPYSEYKSTLSTCMRTLSILGTIEDYVVMEGRNHLEVAFSMPNTNNFLLLSLRIL